MSSSTKAFDPFAVDDRQETGRDEQSAITGPNAGSDPWSSDAWGTSAEFLNISLDTTFDSTNIIEFSATEGTDFLNDAFDEAPHLFPSDPMAFSTTAEDAPAFHMTIHERLSCIYDGSSNSGHVDGSIHIRPSKSVGEPFCLIIHDSNGHIDRINGDQKFCRDITDVSSLDIGDNAFRIELGDGNSLSSPIIRYRCSSEVHPIPLLVKSKVQARKDDCRVGIKLRSNPANRASLKDVIVMLAVPPDVQGESIRASREGGIWDGMKRLVAWSIQEVPPGELITIQAQFEYISVEENEDTIRATPKFPVLVRCDADKELFSDVMLTATRADDFSALLKMSVSRSVRILHRKV